MSFHTFKNIWEIYLKQTTTAGGNKWSSSIHGGKGIVDNSGQALNQDWDWILMQDVDPNHQLSFVSMVAARPIQVLQQFVFLLHLTASAVSSVGKMYLLVTFKKWLINNASCKTIKTYSLNNSWLDVSCLLGILSRSKCSSIRTGPSNPGINHMIRS